MRSTIEERVGTAKISISGDNRYRLLTALLNENISIRDMTDAAEKISGSVSLTKLRSLKTLCEKYETELTVESEKGLLVSGRRYYKHYGIPAGLIAVVIMLTYLSNTLFQVRIIGADTNTRREINAVLDDFGIGFGSFIPSIDFYALETALTKDTDSIAWAGIRSNGSELIINVSQTKQTPDMTQKRMPASIVSSRDAVITDFTVYCGEIDFLIGDAVAEGQILISGEYYDKNGNMRYRYSQASITGRFTDVQTFFEPYIQRTKSVKENALSESVLRFFNTDIRLFSKQPTGRYIEHKSVSYMNFLGLPLPIGTTKYVYDSYDYVQVTRTEREVKDKLDEDIAVYEQNFLSDCEIIDKKVTYKASPEGITATVSYTAEGEIGETKIIFPKKM